MNETDTEALDSEALAIIQRESETGANDWMEVAASRVVDHLLPGRAPGNLGTDRVVLTYCGDGSVEAVFFPKGPRSRARAVGRLGTEHEERAKDLHAHISQLPANRGPSGPELMRSAMSQAPEINCGHCGYEGGAVRNPGNTDWECKECGKPRSQPPMPGSGSTPIIPEPGYENES